MADTFTTHYFYTLVEIGASRDTWGTKENTNWNSIDTHVDNLQTQATSLQAQITAMDAAYKAADTAALTTARNEYKAWVPIGTICLWALGAEGSGPGHTPPPGWAICDGRTVVRTDGGGNITTPNMMGRFILADPNPNQFGGNAAFTGSTASAGTHSHTGATDVHALTIAEMPSHAHSYGPGNQNTVAAGTGAGTGWRADTPATTNTGLTGGGAGHTHPIFSDGAHTHTMTIVPLFFTAIYIMRY